MKKLFVLLLFVIYGSATLGTTVHFHYCMNKVVGWSLNDSQDHKCHTCGMEKKNSCCKDSKTQIKLVSEQQKADPAQNIHFNCQLISAQPIASDYLSTTIVAPAFVPSNNDSLPLLQNFEEPEFLCVFRI